ncbi:phospholipase D-like domain-containing protein [Xanthomonas euvesicatoria]|uniref:phospholipase D-like domain-containing protein n=1 Tax=Xanthomonas euvesicatoria TaxID=456327 RepID=UPI001C468A0B|nr:phospholipase D-like domain-containing protein [Xanthomonas euvesicatoria]MBV6829922.1 hypothetical protein [Xanthomonas campestris pv. viegasii]
MPKYLSKTADFLAATFPQASPLWNFSSQNTLPASWLYATPTDVWGINYDQFKQAVPGTATDFQMQVCTTASGQTQQCVPVSSTVLSPGSEPAKLLAGHSYEIYDELYNVMTSASVLLDVTTLTPPTGDFLIAFNNALAFLTAKPEAERPVIRILYSNPLPNVPPLNGLAFLQSITAGLDPTRKLEIYVTVMSSSFSSWNHAKIVAADGERALVGGHNMWGAHYLGANPVFDVSMRLDGAAARHAQDYANGLWDYELWRANHLGKWIVGGVEEDTLHCAYTYDTSKGRCSVSLNAYPPADLYAHLVARFKTPPPAADLPVLAVGRGANTRSSYFLPTIYSFLYPFTEPSDEALLNLLDQAQSSVRMSLQAFRLIGADLNFLWNAALFKTMGKALLRGVSFRIVLSNPGAVAGDLSKASAPYNGDLPADITEKMRLTLIKVLGIADADARGLIESKFQVASFRYSAQATYPGQIPIPNHAKTFMVDDAVFYIGSQNLYVCNLNEFGFMVEDAVAATAYKENYWTPLWNFSSATLDKGYDADVDTLEQAEAMAFMFELWLNSLLALQWDTLHAQWSAASGDEKAGYARQLDEIILNAGYQTSLGYVTQAQVNPFFTETPPSTKPTAEALRFVANLSTSTTLLAALAAVIEQPTDSADAANQAITVFLRQNGYTCSALEVLAALAQMRRKVLAYWTGTYETWLTQDGGASYHVHNDLHRDRLLAMAADVPLPALIKGLEITAESDVKFNDVLIAKPSYNDYGLSWSAADGNTCSADLKFGAVSRPTASDSFTGLEVFGTVTFPSDGTAPTQDTFSLYGRAPMPAPQQNGKDKPTYTILYILAGVLAIALVTTVCVLRWRRSAARDEWVRIGKEKRANEDRDNYQVDRATAVKSPKQEIELKEIQRQVTQDRIEIQQDLVQEISRFSTSMSARQRITLQEAGTQLTEARKDLDNPTTSELPVVVDRAQLGCTSVQGSINALVEQLKHVFSSNSRAIIEEGTRVADTATKSYENLAKDREEDRPFEFEEEW